jgi:hypothetical protein
MQNSSVFELGVAFRKAQNVFPNLELLCGLDQSSPQREFLLVAASLYFFEHPPVGVLHHHLAVETRNGHKERESSIRL